MVPNPQSFPVLEEQWGRLGWAGWERWPVKFPHLGAATTGSNSSARPRTSRTVWGGNILRVIGRLWICHFAFPKSAVFSATKREKQGKGTVLTKPFAAALMWMQLKGLLKFRGGRNVLFNRTHPLCTAAQRLLPPACLNVTAGTPDPSGRISVIGQLWLRAS